MNEAHIGIDAYRGAGKTKIAQARAVHLAFFTVVIPCYNRAAEIFSALASVRDQTFTDYECIVVDDGSDDHELLRHQVASLNDERFFYYWQPNGGGGAARNAGIAAAQGKYIAFLDSDDIFLPEKLQRVHDFVRQYEVDAVYSKAYVDRGVEGRVWIRPDRAIGQAEDMGEYLFVSNQFVPTPTIVMRTAAAKRVLFDPTLRKGQDLDFCLRAHADGIRFRMIDEPLITWMDAIEAGRASRHSGAAAPTEWLRRSATFMTRKARLGYRVTVLAYYQPKWKFGLVLWDAVVGFVVAGVPLRIIARQLLRFFLPRVFYRRLADSMVALLGLKTHH